jgi:hypothetical protein
MVSHHAFFVPAAMHNTFQCDLCRLKLEVARAYAKIVSFSLAPVINSKDISLKISAQVQGLGPLFQLTLAVQNTAPSAVLTNLSITFKLKCDESLYGSTRNSHRLLQFLNITGQRLITNKRLDLRSLNEKIYTLRTLSFAGTKFSGISDLPPKIEINCTREY